MENNFLEENGVFPIEKNQLEKMTAAVDRLKEIQPLFELDFREKDIYPNLNGFKDDLFKIDLLEKDFREQLKQGYIELPISIGTAINPITERTYELIPTVKKYGGGFFKVTLQSFEMTLNNKRKLDRNRMEKLEFFIGYDIERQHYFLSRTEDAFLGVYEASREVLEDESIQNTIKIFETCIKKFFGDKINEIADGSIASIHNIYFLFNEFKIIHDLYFKILLYTNIITNSVYSSLQTQYKFINTYIQTYFKDIVENVEYDETDKQDALVKLAEKFSKSKRAYYSDNVSTVNSKIKSMVNRSYFIDVYENTANRSFYEEYHYHQKSMHHFETKKYLDDELKSQEIRAHESESYYNPIIRNKKPTK